jgi:3-hydroxy acid dehydrogenase/malonic semialdehyde reductase
MLRSVRLTVPIAATLTAFSGGNLKAFSQARKSARVTPLNLKGQVVLITGATAGIGASCAWQFAEEGCNLILVGRREDKLQEVKKEILESYPTIDIHTVPLSVTDLDKVAELPNKLPAKFRNVDILVNNAGLALGVTPAHENDVEAAKTVLDTNVLGMIAMCRAFLPGMKERGSGHLINMGSIAVSLHVHAAHLPSTVLQI